MIAHRLSKPLLCLIAVLLGAAPLLPGFEAEAAGVTGRTDSYGGLPYRSLTDMLPVDLGGAYQAFVDDAKVRIEEGRFRYAEMSLSEALKSISTRIQKDGGDALVRVKGLKIAGNADKLQALGVGTAAIGQPWTALAAYRLAHDLDPKSVNILVNMAGLANSLGMPSEALALLAEAERRAGSKAASAALYANRGHALVLLRRNVDAEAPLREALRRNPYLREATRSLVVALTLQGRKEEAKQLMPAAVWRRSAAEKFDYVGHGVKGDPFSEEEPQLIQLVPPEKLLDMKRGIPGELPKLTIPAKHTKLLAWEMDAMAAMETAMTAQMNHSARVPTLLQAATSQAGGYSGRINSYLHGYMNTMLSTLTVDMGLASNGEGGVGGEMQANPTYSREELAAYPKDVRDLHERLAKAQVQLNKAIEENSRKVAELKPPGNDERADGNGCFPTDRRNADALLGHILADVTNFDSALVELHRRVHEDATAVAANVGDDAWNELMSAEINAYTAQMHGLRAMTIGAALQNALGVGRQCSLPETTPSPLEEKKAPKCDDTMQQYPFKAGFDVVSIEVTCGKAKVVFEPEVYNQRVLGVHAEMEITMAGEVTIFAGPKLTMGMLEAGPLGADFGIKNGMYITATSDGVQDFGHRVVVGGGAAVAGAGVSHDVDQVDMSWNVSQAEIVSAFTGTSSQGIVNGPPSAATSIRP